MRKNYGFMWARDKQDEDLLVTLENGCKRFREKFKREIGYIECSLKDRNEEFMFKDIRVIPKRNFMSGVIWIREDESQSLILDEKGDI